jgi:hypothetical protein
VFHSPDSAIIVLEHSTLFGLFSSKYRADRLIEHNTVLTVPFEQAY